MLNELKNILSLNNTAICEINKKKYFLYKSEFFKNKIFKEIINNKINEIKDYFLSNFEKNKPIFNIRIKTDYKIVYYKSAGFNGKCQELAEGEVWIEFYLERNLFNYQDSIDELLNNILTKQVIYNLNTNRINQPKSIEFYYKEAL